MKRSFIKLLACPSCLLKVKLKTSEKEEADEIIEGTLTCMGCEADFEIKAGIPIFLTPQEKESHVAKSFGFEWKMHHEGAFEEDAVFGRTLDEDVAYFFEAFSMKPEQLKNKLVLDGGCGSGALTVELAKRFPDCTFVALDINPAIMKIYENSIDIPNLHVIHASVFNIPFSEQTFDFVWSNGVIHHTGNTRGAFDSLTERVKIGGRAYFWVYQKKVSPLVALRMVLIPLGLKCWNHQLLYRFCQLISLPTWLAVRVLALFGKSRFIKKYTHVKILTRNRGYKELVLTWFDVLSPKYRDTYSKSEFESWFIQNNFQDILHYWWPVGISGRRT